MGLSPHWVPDFCLPVPKLKASLNSTSKLITPQLLVSPPLRGMGSEITFKARLMDGGPQPPPHAAPRACLPCAPSLAKVCLSLATWDQNCLCCTVDVQHAVGLGLGLAVLGTRLPGQAFFTCPCRFQSGYLDRSGWATGAEEIPQSSVRLPSSLTLSERRKRIFAQPLPGLAS